GNVLKYGKVQVRGAGSDQDVAAPSASQIETHRERLSCGDRARAVNEGSRITISLPKGHARRRWQRKALRLDVIVRISGIDQRLASRSSQAIREIPGVAAVQSLWITVGSESRSKRNAITYFVDPAQLPATCDPSCGARQGFRRRNLPGESDYQGPADIEIGETTDRSQLVPGLGSD